MISWLPEEPAISDTEIYNIPIYKVRPSTHEEYVLSLPEKQKFETTHS